MSIDVPKTQTTQQTEFTEFSSMTGNDMMLQDGDEDVEMVESSDKAQLAGRDVLTLHEIPVTDLH